METVYLDKTVQLGERARSRKWAAETLDEEPMGEPEG
jgi:hypothetical protein